MLGNLEEASWQGVQGKNYGSCLQAFSAKLGVISDCTSMRSHLDLQNLLDQASALIGQSFREWRQPDAGADHVVLLVTTERGERLVLKAGAEADVDAYVLALLGSLCRKVPALIAQEPLGSQEAADTLIVMSMAEGTLLADVAESPACYLRPLLEEMHQVHTVTTTQGAGPVLAVRRGSRLTWREYLLSVLTGADAEFRWEEIASHPQIDAYWLATALAALAAKAQSLTFPSPLSLLHGDLNPYNVFVGADDVTAIIDWSYARYGDPLFDFARLRMNPFIRSHAPATEEYHALLDLRPDDAEREAFYFAFNLLEYVNWYFLQGELTQAQEQLHLLRTALPESLPGY